MSNLLQQGAEPQSDITTVFIYGLVDPKTGYIRYIGKAADALIRYERHFSKAELSPNTRKVNWIKSLLAQGLKPYVVVIERVEETVWQEAECGWIDFYRSQPGYPELTNGTAGGDGIDRGTKFSQETRNKMSQSRMGRKLPPDVIAKRIATIKERREKAAESHRGKRPEGSSSAYLGVIKVDDYWRASIYVNEKNIYIGRFSEEVEAAKSRDRAAIKFFGRKTKTNFPASEYSEEEIKKGLPKYGKRINNTSGYKGVYWHTNNKKWVSAARENGKRISFGLFPNTEEGKIEAARTYDRWMIQRGGPTAYTNFPRSDYQ